MIDVSKKTKGDVLWVIDVIGPETTFAPKKVFFEELESANSVRLVYVLDDGRKICYPTRVLFESIVEAELCSAIAFLKAHNTDDLGFEITEKNLKELVSNAMRIIEKYEVEHPDKFLYHWMTHVSEI